MSDTRPDIAGHWPATWPWKPDAAPVEAEEAMVATTDRYATEVGLEVLRSGGGAVDAAVAVSFALAVVNPEAGNVGGGGFMLVRTAAGDLAAIDYRSTAPAAATRDMFLDAGGEATDRSVLGHLAVAVPGSVRGLEAAHRRFGARRWAELVEPAVELARGFEVRERFTRSFEPHIVEGLRRFPVTAAVFLPGGRPPRVGETFRQPDLARTLERIRDRGAEGFYRGETADLLVAEMERGGGVLTHDDLTGYAAAWREPLRAPYREHTLVSMPPSSSGGVTLAATAAILERFDLGASPWHGAGHVHLLAEAWRRAYADRNHYLADPAFVDMPIETLTSPRYGTWRARDVSPEAATPSSEIRPGAEAFAGGAHTTHFSIVDAGGAAVSCTTTLNTWYGSKVVAGGTGVLLNNEMDDLSARPGTPNFFGLVQGEANAVEPGKRPLSAMTPTLVLDGRGELRLVVGTPGGATIITTVFQVVSNMLDHGMALAPAVAAPRVHHQHLPDQLWTEPGGLPEDVMRELRGWGHRVVERDEWSGDVQAVRVGVDGSLEGAADPRRGGVALGY
ncbi:MAG: gamma-glutamyltransferase [Gemmatimonadetes bacterium]|nr:gamma-glutamyltransferase [Gemmatimonadota bacterium]